MYQNNEREREREGERGREGETQTHTQHTHTHIQVRRGVATGGLGPPPHKFSVPPRCPPQKIMHLNIF